MNRLMTVSFFLLFAALLTACEDGPPVDGGGPPSGGARDLLLELTTPTPITAGNPFAVRATLTEDGSPVSGVSVTFSAINGTLQEKFVSPNPVQTALISGTADTTVNTAGTDRNVTVTASAAEAADATLQVTLQAP